MTTFKDQLASDLVNVFFNPLEFGQAATYTPNGGAAVAITIVPGEEDLSGQVPSPPGDLMIILVQYADAATPAHGDTFTISGVTWYFDELVSGGPSSGVWHIRITRSARRDIGGGRRLS